MNIIYDNRELSWLKFNMRVLQEAQNENVPPLSRLDFLGITTSNLDEFFMIRVGKLLDDQNRDISGLLSCEQLSLIYKKTKEFYKCKKLTFDRVKEVLKENGISILNCENLFDGKKNILQKKFEKEIMPFLSVQIVDLKKPFPHLENKETYLALHLLWQGKELLGIVSKTDEIKNVISINEKEFLLIDEVIYEYGEKLFSNFKVLDKCLFRITRNGDIKNLEKEFAWESDYRIRMGKILKKRKKLSPVRIEISKQISKDFKKLILNKSPLDIMIINKNPLSFDFIDELKRYISKDLKESLSYPKFVPENTTFTTDMFSQIRNEDILLSYPYHSMKPFFNLLDESVSDENVMSIKICLYRMNTNSRVIQSLIKASEMGKEVLAVLELRARFSEENNINYSEILEENGVKVIYGEDKYKIHSKLCLITRKNKNKTEYFTHIATGNYNEITAKQYTDLNLLTNDYEIGKDAENFFNNILNREYSFEYNKLITSPYGIEKTIISELEECDKAVLKCNALTEKSVIDELIRVAEKGVKIKLIVRGACCLIPQNENIEIISVVGRFLEHSRIYAFYKGNESKIYISSADLMTRNLKNRVELAVEIKNENIKKQIENILEKTLKDDVKARKLNEKGEYEFKENINNFNSQEYFCETHKKPVTENKEEKCESFFVWLVKNEN